MTKRSAKSTDADTAAPRRSRRRVITTVDDEAGSVRRNVRDAARAVLTWVSAVLDHDGHSDLDAVLDRCLRPGPDVTRVNYTALADEISKTTQIELSPKRLKTAIEHLRNGRRSQAADMPKPSAHEKLESLHARLRANFEQLMDDQSGDHDELNRSIAVEVLAAVRRAASRVIENDFGEGIPQSVDVDHLESRFLDFVRRMVGAAGGTAEPGGHTLAADLHRLLVTLCDYDGSSETDMRLVVDGARVVADLTGPDSLAGVTAQLNVLVAGRPLLDGELYCPGLTG